MPAVGGAVANMSVVILLLFIYLFLQLYLLICNIATCQTTVKIVHRQIPTLSTAPLQMKQTSNEANVFTINYSQTADTISH